MNVKKNERVEILKNINEDDMVNQMWDIYLKSFGSTSDTCPQTQICYTFNSFKAALSDNDYWVFVYTVDNEVIGFLLLTNDLDKASVAYIDPDFYRLRFPVFANQKRIYYVSAFGVLPEMQTKGFGFLLLESVCKFIKDNRGMVAFDYSEEKNAWLPDVIQRVGRAISPNTKFELGSQKYVSMIYDEDGPAE